MIYFNPSLKNSFYKNLAWMITADPKKKYSRKQTTDNIVAIEVKNVIDETGVHLQFYTGSEYDRLSIAQRAELNNWRHCSAGNALPLETLKVVDAVVMVGAVEKVDVVGVVVVVEKVEAGVEANLKAKLQQSYPKLPEMKLIISLMP